MYKEPKSNTMKNRIFLFFCMIIVINTTSAQQSQLQVNTGKLLQLSPSVFEKEPSPSFSTNTVISPDFYKKNLSFFCRQELLWQAATRVPFKFRLGSVQYCDWMEGKGNNSPVRSLR